MLLQVNSNYREARRTQREESEYRKKICPIVSLDGKPPKYPDGQSDVLKTYYDVLFKDNDAHKIVCFVSLHSNGKESFYNYKEEAINKGGKLAVPCMLSLSEHQEQETQFEQRFYLQYSDENNNRYCSEFTLTKINSSIQSSTIHFSHLLEVMDSNYEIDD